MTVAEILNQSKADIRVKAVGWITVGRTNRLYACQEDAESESRASLNITNTEEVRDSLLKSVPPFGGGDHLYHDEAAVEGVLRCEGPRTAIQLTCVTVQRDQQIFRQQIEEQIAPPNP